MANNSSREKSIINRSDSSIVLTESKVSLSDEKLKSMLMRTYERAEKDTLKPSITRHYGEFLSISGTIGLTLLTSSFNSVGALESKVVTNIAGGIAVVCGVLGIVFLLSYSSRKACNSRDNRDHAVNEIMDEYVKSKVTSVKKFTSDDS